MKKKIPLDWEWIIQEILCTLKQISPAHIDQVIFQDEKHNRLGVIVPALQTYQPYATDEVQLETLRKSRVIKPFDPRLIGWIIFTSEEIRVEKAITIWQV